MNPVLCGANPNARQIRDTAVWLIPSSVANDRGPVRGIGRGGLQGAGDHRLDLVIRHRARPTRPRLIHQALEPVGHKRDRLFRALLTRISSLSAIAVWPNPSAAASTIRDPHRQRIGTLRLPRPCHQLGMLIEGVRQHGAGRRFR